MNVGWSDEALYALVALEIQLAARYSTEKRRSSTSWFDASIAFKIIRDSGV